MEDEKNMGELFREAFRDFERKPSDKVWQNIENGVKFPDFQKARFFNSKGFFIGIAAIVVVSIFLLLILPKVQNENTQPKHAIIQAIENVQPDLNQDKLNTILPSVKMASQTLKTNNTSQNNLIQTDVKAKAEKRQNIHDLIAQIDNNSNVSEKNPQNTTVKTAIVSKSNNSVAVQKPAEIQQIQASPSNISKTAPICTISFSPDQTICKGEKVKLNIKGGVNFLWSTGEKTQYIIVNPGITTDYSVIATDENGIQKTAIITVNISDCNAPFIPNAFSPNGDGQSDMFKVYANNISKFEIIIVSRSGQIVYTSKNPDEAWDGNYKGMQAQEGVYIYTVKYINELNKEQIINGHITLIRN